MSSDEPFCDSNVSEKPQISGDTQTVSQAQTAENDLMVSGRQST